VIFLDDNAKPHRSRQTKQTVQDMGWETLDHAPYNPDMAPSDFYLFRSLEHWLRGKKFRTLEEMCESLTEFFDSKDRDWYRRGIVKLEEQWQKVIENNGEYLDYSLLVDLFTFCLIKLCFSKGPKTYAST